MYQAQAEMEAEDIPRADGLALIAAHRGRAITLTEWLDPSYKLCNESQGRLANFDIWESVKSPAFLRRFRKGQIERNHRISKWIKKCLSKLGGEDRGFLLEGTMANPFFESLEGGFMGDTKRMNNA